VAFNKLDNDFDSDGNELKVLIRSPKWLAKINQDYQEITHNPSQYFTSETHRIDGIDISTVPILVSLVSDLSFISGIFPPSPHLNESLPNNINTQPVTIQEDTSTDLKIIRYLRNTQQQSGRRQTGTIL
jgi:hypothetical protein